MAIIDSVSVDESNLRQYIPFTENQVETYYPAALRLSLGESAVNHENIFHFIYGAL
jgi:hypothetical protein